MKDKFHRELDMLKEKVLEMGRMAAGMLSDSVEALKEHNIVLAEDVRNRRGVLTKYDLEIEKEALRLIALYQPMASDLRTLACVLKMITYLTRVGRYGKDIADVVITLGQTPHPAKLVSIPYMADIARGMLDDALRAFMENRTDLFEDFAERDDKLDTLRWNIFRECITYMMEDTKNITRCAHYIMVAKYLERCGDHACKMAEKIHYMVTGEVIEIK